MVLTRNQAALAKNRDSQSQETAPKVTKPSRKQPSTSAAVAGAATAAASADPAASSDSVPLRDKQANLQAARLMNSGISSHPISSLTTSPERGASPGIRIEAVSGAAAALAQQLEQQQGKAGEGLPAAPRARKAAGTATSPGQAPEPAAAAGAGEQQLPAAPPPQRAEKLLKPLPDKPVQCDKLPDGPEPVQIEVEYIAREDLQPVDDAAAALEVAVPGLGASDWVEAVKALNLLRQLVVHHPDACSQQLEQLVPLVLKSVRSLRSSVCKTAIMAVVDMYQTYGDALLPHTDVGGQLKPVTSLLSQILLKCSSNDKKFVIEEAQRALQVMVASLSPAESLRLLLPYADTHKNPKVRGKAGGAAAEAVALMQPTDLLAFGLPRLLQVSGKLVTDNTPDARESAKKIIGVLKATFSSLEVEQQLTVELPAPAAAGAGERDAAAPAPAPSKWEVYCQAHLSSSAVLAVLKASTE